MCADPYAAGGAYMQPAVQTQLYYFLNPNSYKP
jgi:hypothetical protein